MDMSRDSVQLRTLTFTLSERVARVTFTREKAGNSLNQSMLADLTRALDAAEEAPLCGLVVMDAPGSVFCSGMDFEAVEQATRAGADEGESLTRPYIQLLRRLSLLSRPIIVLVDGEVIAGGVGLVAASDLVFATPRSRFALTEALWGLLPAMVAPYLIRRVGYQNAYKMALTTLPVSADRACAIGLVDEVTDSPEQMLQRLRARLLRVGSDTVRELKRYFRSQWLLDDAGEERACAEAARSLSTPEARSKIMHLLREQQQLRQGSEP